VSPLWIRKAARSGLPTRIATTENVSLCTRMKSWLRLLNSNRGFARSVPYARREFRQLFDGGISSSQLLRFWSSFTIE
jgi:hypothetical protein